MGAKSLVLVLFFLFPHIANSKDKLVPQFNYNACHNLPINISPSVRSDCINASVFDYIAANPGLDSDSLLKLVNYSLANKRDSILEEAATYKYFQVSTLPEIQFMLKIRMLRQGNLDKEILLHSISNPDANIKHAKQKIDTIESLIAVTFQNKIPQDSELYEDCLMGSLNCAEEFRSKLTRTNRGSYLTFKQDLLKDYPINKVVNQVLESISADERQITKNQKDLNEFFKFINRNHLSDNRSRVVEHELLRMRESYEKWIDYKPDLKTYLYMVEPKTAFVQYFSVKKSDRSKKVDLSNEPVETSAYYFAIVAYKSDDHNIDLKVSRLGSQENINEKIDDLRSKILHGSPATALVLKELYNQLLSPLFVGDKFPNAIIVAPISKLNVLPFNILKDKNDVYLFEKTRMHYGHPYTALKEKKLLDELKQFEGYPTESSKGVVFANPKFRSLGKESKTKQTTWPYYYTELPHSKTEGDRIKSIYKGNVILNSGENLKESNLINIKSPSFLHFATHSFFLPRTMVDKYYSDFPLVSSGLAFSGFNNLFFGTKTNHYEDDGIFTASEASKLQLLKTDLVVLSACETGFGNIIKGESVGGLRQAFRMAGANNVIMSLWNIGDKHTADFMERFYKYYNSGLTPLISLQKTRNDLRAIEDDVFRWGGFSLESTIN